MARTFITRIDIDRLADSGQEVLEVDDSTTVTDVARDQALHRGLRIVRRDEAARRPSAAPGGITPPMVTESPPRHDAADRERVRAMVVARLGSEPDGLDAAIDRALDGGPASS